MTTNAKKVNLRKKGKRCQKTVLEKNKKMAVGALGV